MVTSDSVDLMGLWDTLLMLYRKIWIVLRTLLHGGSVWDVSGPPVGIVSILVSSLFTPWCDLPANVFENVYCQPPTMIPLLWTGPPRLSKERAAFSAQRRIRWRCTGHEWSNCPLQSLPCDKLFQMIYVPEFLLKYSYCKAQSGFILFISSTKYLFCYGQHS